MNVLVKQISLTILIVDLHAKCLTRHLKKPNQLINGFFNHLLHFKNGLFARIVVYYLLLSTMLLLDYCVLPHGKVTP